MVPPLIGAKDMAFPRINALSFWLIPTAGVIMWLGAANIGWTGYTPLSVYDKSFGVDMWIVGLQLLGISSTAGAINFLVTIFRHRAPGITFNNLSLFVWSIMVTQGLVLLATPVLAGGLFILLLDRHGMTALLPPLVGGDPILWQHLFWFYSHPAVYIMILPAMGILSEVIPRMSHKPLLGCRPIALSTVEIGLLPFGGGVRLRLTTGHRTLAFRLHDRRLQRRLLHDALPRPPGDAEAHLRLQLLRAAVPLLDPELARVDRGVHPRRRATVFRREHRLDVRQGPRVGPGSVGRNPGAGPRAARPGRARLRDADPRDGERRRPRGV